MRYYNYHRLREIRTAKAMTIQELVDRIRAAEGTLSYNYYGAIERGEQENITVRHLVAIINALGVSPNAVIEKMSAAKKKH